MDDPKHNAVNEGKHMDVEESMELESTTITSQVQDSASDQLDRICLYAQNGVKFWQLPADPFSSQIAGPRLSQPHGHGYYSKRCRIIAKNWHSKNPNEWLPSEMLDKTCYSLTLLDALARLSSITKNQKAEAHDAIIAAHTKRLRSHSYAAYTLTAVNTKSYESKIVERGDGMMVADVRDAHAQIEQEGIARKQQRYAMHTNSGRTSDRVEERRQHKIAQDIELQRELWSDQADSQVELVGIEYSNGHSTLASSATNGPSLWQTLKKQAKVSKKKAKKARRLMHLKSGSDRSHEQLLRALAAEKAASFTTNRPPRANDMSALVNQLDEDDISWDDSDDDDDDKFAALDKPIDREPEKIRKNTSEQTPVNRLANSVQSKSAMIVDDTDKQGVASSRRVKKLARAREREKRQQAEAAWLESVKARSQRLPSEIMNFSTLGKLQSTADQAEMSEMADALCDMLEGSKG